MSKQVVDKTNSDVIENLEFHQWRNTNGVLKWFSSITDKLQFYSV